MSSEEFNYLGKAWDSIVPDAERHRCKSAVDEEDLWAVFARLAQAMARAQMPEEVIQPLRIGRMSAFTKDNGRVRGIVAGAVLRRLVCKAVARQFASSFMESMHLYQFAL